MSVTKRDLSRIVAEEIQKELQELIKECKKESTARNPALKEPKKKWEITLAKHADQLQKSLLLQ